jgi:ATP-dependent DNA helicase RecG
VVLSTEAAGAVSAIVAGGVPRDHESQTLDFKTVGRSKADAVVDLAEAAACFANADGGQIVVGVRDSVRGRDALVGTDLDPVLLKRRIFELTDPGLLTDVRSTEEHGPRLVVITVPAGLTVHQVKGRAVERIGTSCITMTTARIGHALAYRGGDDWSARPSGTTLEDVDGRSVEEARAVLAGAVDDERRAWADLSTPDLLRRLGVVLVDGGLTNAGDFLFVRRPEPVPSSVLKGRVRGDLRLNEFIPGAGLTALLRCLELVSAANGGTPVNVGLAAQILVRDVPEAAAREAVTNAVMHRDHSTRQPIEVEHDGVVLIVTSPGGFVPGVTAENVLTTSSHPRNLGLATAVRNLGLAERAGVGVDRMYAEMTMVGHEPPRFVDDGHRLTVTLVGGHPNAPLLLFLLGLPVDIRRRPDIPLIIRRLLVRRVVRACDLVADLQKPEHEVERVLDDLTQEPLAVLERTRFSARRRAGEYRLTPQALGALGSAVTYSRSEVDLDDIVADVISETGTLTSRLFRTLTGVAESTASRQLSELVSRGVLVRTSAAARGPNVTYGPGPNFPADRAGRRR